MPTSFVSSSPCHGTFASCRLASAIAPLMGSVKCESTGMRVCARTRSHACTHPRVRRADRRERLNRLPICRLCCACLAGPCRAGQANHRPNHTAMSCAAISRRQLNYSSYRSPPAPILFIGDCIAIDAQTTGSGRRGGCLGRQSQL